jgi:uncharacterized protein YfaP (DUF2135 family)
MWLLSVLLISGLFINGCSSSSGGGLLNHGTVTWGNITDANNATVSNGGTTNFRSVTIRGTISTVSEETITGNTAMIYNNGDFVATLPLTQNGLNYTFEKKIELFSGGSDNNLVIRYESSTASGYLISDTYVIRCLASAVLIHVQLIWDKDDSDVDLHFIKPGGDFAPSPAVDSGDCGYSNKTPDWNGNGIRNEANGGAINDPQDPALDVDNTNGYGPENVVIQAPPDGVYTVKVYYWADHGGHTTFPTVKIWVNSLLMHTYYCNSPMTVTAGNHSLWTPCTLTVSGNNCTITTIDTITTQMADRDKK